MGAVLAALTSSVQAQYNESAVMGPNGGPFITVMESSPIRWTVTSSGRDVLAIRTPERAPNETWRCLPLNQMRLGLIDGERQLVVERIEYLPNSQIRVALRHDPFRVWPRDPSVRIRPQGELIGGDVQLWRGTTLIDSDPVVAIGTVY